MMRRAVFRLSVLCVLALTLPACGWLFGGDEEEAPPPPPPPMPTIVSLELEAGGDVNPDPFGQAKPVSVKVYQLKSVNGFLGADFFSLDQNAAGALGGALVAEDSFVLGPGSRRNYQRELDDGVRFIGVAVAFRNIDTANWRAWYEVMPNRTTLLRAIIGADDVVIREALK